jgi:hypothetical protein
MHLLSILFFSSLNLKDKSIFLSTNIRWYDMFKPLLMAFLLSWDSEKYNFIILAGLIMFLIESLITLLLERFNQLIDRDFLKLLF